MKRIPITPRADWKEKADEFGFSYHSMDGHPYWQEDAYYQFTIQQVETLESATEELHKMCLNIVEEVVKSDELLEKFNIPKHVWSYIRLTWELKQPSLYSRLDFAYDGVNPPKLLENNADTPTMLFESAFFQLLWLDEQMSAGLLPAPCDQFNTLQERLIARFKILADQYRFTPLHFTCAVEAEEDVVTVQYLSDCALEAGIPTKLIPINEIGLGHKGQFTDLDDEVIANIFKLYPWELMLREDFSMKLEEAGTRWLEPVWKAILSNKALLPMLWKRYPNHPNLLPAYFPDEVPDSLTHYVEKPYFSREGSNISIIENGEAVEYTEGPYEDDHFIIQAFHPLPQFEGSYTVIGSWLVDGKSCGIGIREDKQRITQGSTRFYPHIIA